MKLVIRRQDRHTIILRARVMNAICQIQTMTAFPVGIGRVKRKRRGSSCWWQVAKFDGACVQKLHNNWLNLGPEQDATRHPGTWF